ncbi:MAG TPA: hypothetical protein VK741_01815, partial [Acetobacteraceae bacterium]|nr:hypothetical protein [Acetobacteraceae bacterium]
MPVDLSGSDRNRRGVFAGRTEIHELERVLQFTPADSDNLRRGHPFASGQSTRSGNRIHPGTRVVSRASPHARSASSA